MNTSSQSPLSKYSRSRGSTAFLMSSSLISGTWECHCCTAPFQQQFLYHGVELDGSLGSICRRAFGLSWVAVVVGIVGINLKRKKVNKSFPRPFEMISSLIWNDCSFSPMAARSHRPTCPSLLFQPHLEGDKNYHEESGSKYCQYCCSYCQYCCSIALFGNLLTIWVNKSIIDQ